MTVSVYITCFNKRNFIGEAIESILNQTLMPNEIIIIDDFSTDGSTDIIKNYANKHPELIFPVFNTENLEIVKTRNIALEKCSGDLITFLDGDDYFYKNKLESEYNTLMNSNAQAVYSNFHYVNERGDITGKFAEKEDSPAEGDIFLNTFGRIYNVSSGNNYIYEMFYRNCLDDMGYYDPKIKLWEDWDFRIRFSKKFRYVYCQEINMVYRKNSGGISRSGVDVHYYYQKKIFQKNRHLLNNFSEKEKEFVYSRVGGKLEGLLNVLMRDEIHKGNWIKAIIPFIKLLFFYKSSKYLKQISKYLLSEKNYNRIINLKNSINLNQ